MRLPVNLRHLAAHSLRLQGELPVAELDIDTRDEMIELAQPVEYDLEVEKLEAACCCRAICTCACNADAYGVSKRSSIAWT